MRKTVLVTGVAGGIGRATAERFRAEDWRVLGTDLPGQDPRPSVDRFMAIDLGDAGAIEALGAGLAAEGPIHALVNNAAMQIAKPMSETAPAEWDAILRVNLRAPFLLTRALIPHLRQEGGAIVNVSSVHAVATSVGVAAYAASKGGLLALTRAMAIELAPQNIRVNAVLPGAVETGMLRDGLSRGHLPPGGVEEQMEALAARTVIGRIGRPAEIAEAILFLADAERSSFMTGQALVVDGGATARLSTE